MLQSVVRPNPNSCKHLVDDHLWEISEIDPLENMVVLSHQNYPVRRRFSAPSKISSAHIVGLDLIIQTVDGFKWAIQIPNGSRKRFASQVL